VCLVRTPPGPGPNAIPRVQVETPPSRCSDYDDAC